MALCSPIFSTTLGRRPQGHSSGVTMVTLLLEDLRATFKFSQSPDRGISEQEGCTAKPLDREGFYGLPCRLYLWECREGAEVQQGYGPQEEWTDACLPAWSRLEQAVVSGTWPTPKKGHPLLAPRRMTGALTTKKRPTGTKEAAAFVLPPSFSSCASGRMRNSFK